MVDRTLLSDLFSASLDRDWSTLPWQPFRPGIEIVRVVGDGSGAATALLRYAPGAQLQAHAHVDLEHIVVLAGSQSDERGTYGAGSVLIHGPGTSHRVRSDEGCIVLAIWSSPVRFEPT